MSVEERVKFLLRIARREEGEGNERIARLFRRMAAEALPLDIPGSLSGGSGRALATD